jgi:hypothetical protein
MKMEQTHCSETSVIPLAYEDGTDSVPKRRLFHSPMKMEQTQCSETSIIPLAYEDEQTQCSETSAIEHHTPGNNTKDYTQ